MERIEKDPSWKKVLVDGKIIFVKNIPFLRNGFLTKSAIRFVEGKKVLGFYYNEDLNRIDYSTEIEGSLKVEGTKVRFVPDYDIM